MLGEECYFYINESGMFLIVLTKELNHLVLPIKIQKLGTQHLVNF
jgi:hypothetical protein